ncbi:D-Ala-D-Ala carboxypeptidase family metallohydrolase [Daeguia caeni]|uniref:Murein endopeptidase K n=1 Tax=Daeguia caeni TaxID=439612 RepID=A0ABV9H6F4_9HYPH
MKANHSTRRINRHLLMGSAALLTLAIAACTATGNGPDGKPLAINTPSSGSVLTDTLQSAADQVTAQHATAAQETTQPAEQQSAPAVQAAETGKPQTNQAEMPATAAQDGAKGEVATEQVAVAEAKPKQAKSLFSLFSSKPDEEKPAEKVTSADGTETADNSKKPESTDRARREVPVETVENKTDNKQEKPVQLASLADSAGIANAFAPQRPDGRKGSISRLFSDPELAKGKTAVARAAPRRDASEYNYSLPGVRPNGGIEIKHRSSMYDDSDIDANEYDGMPGITLASAPGLGRLLPNGLRVRRETVDVACLKPKLVAMLKQMERHFRRPVFITSGYRSPAYNRKVNGARRSLHMICAAADIQIDGVSKWEIARYARSMPGRGGVGTYCNTTAVHIDIGPERDWNWRCKGS